MVLTDEQVKVLYSMLSEVNVSDEHMSRHVDLTQTGREKVSKKFGISLDDVEAALDQVSEYVRDKVLMETNKRFGYEKDAVGNVKLHDSQTGKDLYLRGDSAFKLQELLNVSPEAEQRVIAQQFGVQPLEEDGGEVSSAKPIGNTFNFPHRGNIATAEYDLDPNGKFVLDVISYRDGTDKEIELTPQVRQELNGIAMKWIDRV